jgi:hypothetical protein
VSRYCEFTSQNHLEFLQNFDVADLDNFFAWFLRGRRSTIKDADTLQTYWNVLGTVRRKETGIYMIPDDTKEKMIGVYLILPLIIIFKH